MTRGEVIALSGTTFALLGALLWVPTDNGFGGSPGYSWLWNTAHVDGKSHRIIRHVPLAWTAGVIWCGGLITCIALHRRSLHGEHALWGMTRPAGVVAFVTAVLTTAATLWAPARLTYASWIGAPPGDLKWYFIPTDGWPGSGWRHWRWWREPDYTVWALQIGLVVAVGTLSAMALHLRARRRASPQEPSSAASG